MRYRLGLSAIAIVIMPILSGCGGGLLDWGRPAEAPASPPSVPQQRPLSLIPEPAKLERHDGRFTLTNQTPLVCQPSDAGCQWIARYFTRLLARTRGLQLSYTSTGPAQPNAVVFKRSAKAAGPEAYTLNVTPDGIVVSASGDAGLFYGAVTLWQLASQDQGKVERIDIPALSIVDAPRFAWRGVLLDSARHFQSPAFVKSFIDAMARHKLNVLQWHLTDDQGWRLQIKRYPRLTSVGAWRPDGKGGRYGGFYTQDEVRDIVAYAQRRHVTIVPEIEMPGHALAAIVAYPWLGSVRHPPKTVSSDWGVFPYLYNVDDRTFAFLENVLTEVMALFPSPYIHIGGDEAVKDQWLASRRIKRQMRKLHVRDVDALQTYFMNRIGRFLSAHGRHPIGWDEILNAGLVPDAAVTSWRSPDSAVQAAKLGHDIVLSPAPTLYFDYCQVLREGEPPCRGPAVTLRDVYGFSLPKADLSHVLGLQGNIWTERMTSSDLVDYAAFPRAAALAELAWSPASDHNWQSFLARMPAQLARYHALGLPHSESAFAVEVTAHRTTTGAEISLANQVDYGTIHYTTDGTTPNVSSPVYQAPFDTVLPLKVEAQAFVDGRALAAPTTADLTALTILRRSSFAMDQCTNDLPLALRTGTDTSMVNVMNPCWIYKGLNLSGIAAIDFGMGDLPFNYQIGQDIKKIPLYPDAPPHGELEIRLDTCQGKVIGSLDLSPTPGAVTTRRVNLAPQSGVHNLCFLFARRSVAPVWTITDAQPVPAGKE